MAPSKMPRAPQWMTMDALRMRYKQCMPLVMEMAKRTVMLTFMDDLPGHRIASIVLPLPLLLLC